MSHKKANRLEMAANILTIVVAIVFLGLVVDRYLLPSKNSQKSPTIGNRVAIQGFVPSDHTKNVLIVMMKGCRFCEGSVDFYKDLLVRSELNNVRIVTVFPVGTIDTENYLASLGLTGIPILYSELSTIEVDATPTIIVADHEGTILNTWIGQLSREKETEVFSFLAS